MKRSFVLLLFVLLWQISMPAQDSNGGLNAIANFLLNDPIGNNNLALGKSASGSVSDGTGDPSNHPIHYEYYTLQGLLPGQGYTLTITITGGNGLLSFTDTVANYTTQNFQGNQLIYTFQTPASTTGSTDPVSYGPVNLATFQANAPTTVFNLIPLENLNQLDWYVNYNISLAATNGMTYISSSPFVPIDGMLVKSVGGVNKTVYYLDNGQKLPFPSVTVRFMVVFNRFFRKNLLC